jgi:hypothetical protein
MKNDPPDPSRLRLHPVTVLIALFALYMPIAQAAPSVRATYTETPPKIDGSLDDAAWAAAEPVTEFAQYRPTYGNPPTEATEIRVLYDYSTLYIAFDCSIANTGEIIGSTTQRDEGFYSDDHVGVYLDTFFDKRNAYAFFANPLATQRDMRIINEGLGQQSRRGGDTSWDATWEVQTERLADRWTAEMAIPFSELRFDPKGDVWGINFWRGVEMNEEDITWADIGARQYNISRFGALHGLDISKLDSGRGLLVTPYTTLSPRKLSGEDFEVSPKVGIDLRYPLTSMTADVTINPDFAQIEADPAEVNLSDVERRFAEKRPFFLEGGGLYRTPIEVFYTRRVQDLETGAKLAGRIGGQDVALMTVQATPFEEAEAEREGQSNVTAARYQRNLGARLGVGFVGVNKYTPDLDRNHGAGGADFTLRLPHDVNMVGQAVGNWTREPGQEGSDIGWETDRAFLIQGERRANTLRAGARYFDTGRNFDSEPGFIPRLNRRGPGASVEYRRQFEGPLNRVSAEVSGQRLTDGDGVLTEESAELDFSLGVSNFFLFFGPERRLHLVEAEEDDENGVDRIYTDETVDLFLGWFPPKHINGRLFQSFGYRDGERSWYMSPNVTVRPTEAFSLEYSLQRELRRSASHLDWQQEWRVQRLQARYQFTQRAFLTGSAEMDAEDTSRFFVLYGTEYRPKSFLFIVYNESHEDGETDRAVFVKLSYQAKL